MKISPISVQTPHSTTFKANPKMNGIINQASKSLAQPTTTNNNASGSILLALAAAIVGGAIIAHQIDKSAKEGNIDPNDVLKQEYNDRV